MYLILTVSLVCGGLVLTAVSLLAARKPRQSDLEEFLVGGFMVPCAIGCFVLPIFLIMKFFSQQAPAIDLWQVVWSGGIAAATVLVIAMMRIGRRLKNYRDITPAPAVVPMPTGQPDSETPEDHFPKAA